MPFNDLVIQPNQVRLKSGSRRSAPLLWERWVFRFLLEVFPPCSVFWNYTAWFACSLELLISDTSGFFKRKCRNCWRNVGFFLPPVGSQCVFFPLQTPITGGYYAAFVWLKCSRVCSVSVEQMWASWPALVSPDSYIVNQSSFSSINDKDLHYYKNLRNLWVCGTCSDRSHKLCLWMYQ